MADQHRIRFYQTAKGEIPVAEFMTELNRTGRAKGASKIIEYSRLLREHGLALGFPYISHVRGDLWELRATFARNAYRLLFFDAGARTFVFLHGLVERNGLDKADIATAERRMADHRRRSAQGGV
jgi:phage-related protein